MMDAIYGTEFLTGENPDTPENTYLPMEVLGSSGAYGQ